jgi:hypothetical protein
MDDRKNSLLIIIKITMFRRFKSGALSDIVEKCRKRPDGDYEWS